MSVSVEIKGLSYSYEDHPVLENLSFSVREGEFFVVIGPNGSGKTTLLKLAAGLLRPERGRLLVMKKDIRDYSRRDLSRRVAFVPQTAPVDFPFRVMEVVLFGRAPHLGIFGLESESDISIARRAMSFTGTDHLADRRMDQLSGGERQRVFVARAICQEPELMILDEPTAALDIAHQMRIMDLMERMKKEKGITVIMVSHDVNLAAMYADTLLLLKNGKSVEWGRPADVLNYRTLEHVYGCPLLVDESPLGSLPRVTPVPGRFFPAS